MIATAAPALPTLPWLLAGPGPGAGPEPLTSHLARLGPRPRGGAGVMAAVGDSGLQGRGGARFPAGTKWRAVAARGRRRAVVLVNGAEGEPASAKDQVLMHLRPHLVLDGALLAAESVGAQEVVLYVGRAFAAAAESLRAALRERDLARPAGRRSTPGPSVELVLAPDRYLAGEETAAVNLVNGGDARPTFTPPRPFERGIRGRPTLVQNVETLALVALIARFGPAWFRSQGTAATPGSMLVTLGGAVARPGVYEVPHGVALDQVVAMAGGSAPRAPAILIGGYFGSWVRASWAPSLRLDDEVMGRAGLSLGTGAVVVLPEQACGVAETARILRFLAGESAGQCGPCRHGLPAMADEVERLAGGWRSSGDGDRLWRWTDQLAHGRGACKHPDGTAGLLRSALHTLAADFEVHARHGECRGSQLPSCLPPPRERGGWR
ncbi:MAG TPA: NADH-ubiquinone oxidoreductase-F iron-sulfur binding region domain-containing protein [Candidatus Dormibacteraeota bacterium]|nr:NADH-ubiquinone oxidoreductase-F iron-sulfur binding region domain-containing protein [Candidatus Dormibacteraeota bacterium]